MKTGVKNPKFFIISIFLIIIIGLTSVLKIFNNNNVDIYTMLAEKGPKYTLNYMTNEETRYKDSYERAWTLYRNSQLAEAKAIVKKLIGYDKDKKLVADSYYLSGHISFYEHDYIHALESFRKSLVIYSELSKHENMYYSYLGVAICLIDLGHMNEAHDTLGKAIKNFEIATQVGIMNLDRTKMKRNEKVGLAQYYLVRKRFELKKGNIEDALLNAEYCMSFYNSIGSKNGMADAMIDVGLFNMMLGRYNEGWKYTFQARIIVNELSDSRKLAYLLLNELIYRKCYEKRPYDLILDEINRQIILFHDNQLEHQLRRVLNSKCN